MVSGLGDRINGRQGRLRLLRRQAAGSTLAPWAHESERSVGARSFLSGRRICQHSIIAAAAPHTECKAHSKYCNQRQYKLSTEKQSYPGHAQLLSKSFGGVASLSHMCCYGARQKQQHFCEPVQRATLQPQNEALLGKVSLVLTGQIILSDKYNSEHHHRTALFSSSSNTAGHCPE